ncbi:hypothetical protein OAO39_02855 [Pirellulaceae bacterium]|nr:hypothetical protein [Pirellulaceae bacterium]
MRKTGGCTGQAVGGPSGTDPAEAEVGTPTRAQSHAGSGRRIRFRLLRQGYSLAGADGSV